MAKRLIPLLDRVLVEKFVPPSKSVGGVLLPESATQKVRFEIKHTILLFAKETDSGYRSQTLLHCKRVAGREEDSSFFSLVDEWPL